MKLLLMRLLTALVALAAVGLAENCEFYDNDPVPVHELVARGSPNVSLDVHLTWSAKSTIRAVVKNNGTVDVSVPKTGSLFDFRPVMKVALSDANGTDVPFAGVRVHPSRMRSAAHHFITLAVDSAVVVDIDVAELYGITAGGHFTAVAAGIMHYQEATVVNLTNVTSRGFVHYTSNVVEMRMDPGAKPPVMAADRVDQLQPQEASMINLRCSFERHMKLVRAFSKCANVCHSGSIDTFFGMHWRFLAYFQTWSQDAKRRVRCKLDAIAVECMQTRNPRIEFFCHDPKNYCADEAIGAYSPVTEPKTYICPISWFLDDFAGCHEEDFTGLVVHELSHHASVNAPRAADWAYGWPRIKGLGPTISVKNADNYQYYAQSAYLGCDE